MRMLSSLGKSIRTHSHRRLTEDDWPRLTQARLRTPLYIDDTPGISPREMRSRIRQLMREPRMRGQHPDWSVSSWMRRVGRR